MDENKKFLLSLLNNVDCVYYHDSKSDSYFYFYVSNFKFFINTKNSSNLNLRCVDEKKDKIIFGELILGGKDECGEILSLLKNKYRKTSTFCFNDVSTEIMDEIDVLLKDEKTKYTDIGSNRYEIIGSNFSFAFRVSEKDCVDIIEPLLIELFINIEPKNEVFVENKVIFGFEIKDYPVIKNLVSFFVDCKDLNSFFKVFDESDCSHLKTIFLDYQLKNNGKMEMKKQKI